MAGSARAGGIGNGGGAGDHLLRLRALVPQGDEREDREDRPEELHHVLRRHEVADEEPEAAERHSLPV